VAALIGAAGVMLLLPAAAQAATKTVDMGLPTKSQGTFNNKYGADVNDFFPHGITIRAGDSVRFVPTGFHTVDFPPKGGIPLQLAGPTGQKVAGVNDAAGRPFWFNGRDMLGLTTDLLSGSFGKKLTYTGSKRIASGLPLAPNAKPMTVRFRKPGTYTYYCNVHIGMKGKVRVLPKSRRAPSARADAKTLKRQLDSDVKIAKRLPTTIPPSGTVDVGVAGPHGVEFFGMVPGTVNVKVGQALTFRMSPGSLEDHTATFGPGDPSDPNQSQSYLGVLANSFNGAVFDPRAVYPSETPGTVGTLTPATHGNGFWNTGVMDTANATPLPSSGTVTFGAPGTYKYYCLIHTFMHGVINVTL
jgi:plastocyanin